MSSSGHEPISASRTPRASLDLWAAYSLHLAYYDFCRIYKMLWVTPAFAAGIAGKLWDLADLDVGCAVCVIEWRPALSQRPPPIPDREPGFFFRDLRYTDSSE